MTDYYPPLVREDFQKILKAFRAQVFQTFAPHLQNAMELPHFHSIPATQLIEEVANASINAVIKELRSPNGMELLRALYILDVPEGVQIHADNGPEHVAPRSLFPNLKDDTLFSLPKPPKTHA